VFFHSLPLFRPKRQVCENMLSSPKGQTSPHMSAPSSPLSLPRKIKMDPTCFRWRTIRHPCSIQKPDAVGVMSVRAGAFQQHHRSCSMVLCPLAFHYYSKTDEGKLYASFLQRVGVCWDVWCSSLCDLVLKKETGSWHGEGEGEGGRIGKCDRK
jgi:hypothetical protein